MYKLLRVSSKKSYCYHVPQCALRASYSDRSENKKNSLNSYERALWIIGSDTVCQLSSHDAAQPSASSQDARGFHSSLVYLYIL